MALDANKLLAFEIPRRRQHITKRDCVLYALSVGFGCDPLDERQLDFVDEQRTLRVVPAMVLVTAHPGFWLADPATGVDPSSVLHGEQSFEILAPLRCETVIDSHTRITTLVDKGAGGPALLYTETTLRDEAGQDIALLNRTTVIRDGRGFGGATGRVLAIRDPTVPPPDHTYDFATRPEQALLYRLNGDLNPLHANPIVSARSGFARPILHGLCTMGIICHALMRTLVNYDSAHLRGMALRFAKPVTPGDSVRTEIWSDGSFRARSLERDVIVVDGGNATFSPSSPRPVASVGKTQC
jgi:acyl dehydratase